MLQKLYVFFRKETVLSIAVILAILSMGALGGCRVTIEVATKAQTIEIYF